jgi:flagellar basal body-associated protein FliL
MPALAYVTTAFILMPRMQKAVATAVAAQAGPATPVTAAGAPPSAEVKPAVEAPAPKPKEAAKDKAGEKGKEADGLDPALKERGAKITTAGKMTVPMNKILVNISGSMGSRYLLASLTLASDKDGFGQLILNNEAQLLDLAAGVLGSKTIADLEKPEARTVVRSELQTVFNNALGPNTVQDVYLTEFAIQ